jgi:hypothetical protein
MILPTNDEKAALWRAYRGRRAPRVPVQLRTNPRVLIQDPKINPDGFTFKQVDEDPHAYVTMYLHYLRYCREVLHRYMDAPTGMPEVWSVDLWVYNVYEAAFFGAPVVFVSDQLPDTEPLLAGDRDTEDVFDVDVEHPLENPYIAGKLAFWREMETICRGLTFEGRPVELRPWAVCGTDGPVTVACNLRGSDFLLDLVEEPDYAKRLLAFVTRAAVLRRAAFAAYWGDRLTVGNGMADDAIAMISTDMYVEQVLPFHRAFFEAGGADSERSMHLCGDATRHFTVIHRALGVTAFDTGFPVDHGALRRTLGPDVEIQGGPEVALLHDGTPDQVYARAQGILQSGVAEGGRFVLCEGNNLPPGCPEANLEALYAACLEHGRY